jgi:hypothetical protein
LRAKRSNPFRRACSKRRMDCFVARAPRNDGKPHFRDLATHRARGLPINFRPLKDKGAGNAGRPMRPAVSCARWSKKAHTSIQVTPESPGTPRAMVLRLISCSPRCSGLLATVVPEMLSLPRNLTPASGCQDHTILPSASGALVSRTLRVHRSPPRERDDRVSPLLWDGMAGIYD